MVSQRGGIVFLLVEIGGHVTQGLCLGIAADVIVTFKVCGRRDDDGGRRGIADINGGCCRIGCYEPAMHHVLCSVGLRAAVVQHLNKCIAL